MVICQYRSCWLAKYDFDYGRRGLQRGPFHGTEEGFNVVTLHLNHVDWEYVDYGWEARRSVKL